MSLGRVYVRDLRDGDEVTATLLVRRAMIQNYRDREGVFLRLRLGDRTGDIEARVWDFDVDKQAVPRPGDLIKVAARATTYQEGLELHIESYSSVRWEEVDPTDYLPVSAQDPNLLVAEIRDVVASMEDPHLRALLESFLSDDAWVSAVMTAPAARINHHAYLGGLLEHTVHLVRMVPVLLRNYPQANRDLLLTGAILHDIGKIEEYTWERYIGVSDRGRLLGHIILGIETVSRRMEAIPSFPAILRAKVLHIMASHHGQYVWQSPKRPKFLEACLVHYIDLLDAEANRFLPTPGSPVEGWEWVDRLDRWVYRGP